jgi:hypothetical protein
MILDKYLDIFLGIYPQDKPQYLYCSTMLIPVIALLTLAS